jgi:SNF2 family DNA or RNA helicase
MLRTPADLYVNQLRAADFMFDNPQAAIFMDMGLGKTGASLTALVDMINKGMGPVLIVGPIRVIETVWPEEAKIWSHTKHLRFSIIRGNPREREEAVRKEADIYLINPEQLRWFLKKYKKYLSSWGVLIVDESSDFKTPGSKRFISLRWQVKKFKRRYILTGTPRPNGYLDLWPQMFIVDLGERLGSTFESYQNRYFEPAGYYGYKWKPKIGAKKRIRRSIADIVLRIEAKGKKPIENRILVPLPPKARKIYEDMEEEALAYLDSRTKITGANVVSAMMKCRQISNGAVYLNDSDEYREIHQEKIKVVERIIEETGDPVIVVYNFKHERDMLAKRLKAYSPVILSKAKDPNKVIKDWNAKKIPVLLLHPKSGGHGLNLQHGGHTMVWLGLTFSYEQYAQTVARLNRTGQTKQVVLHLLIAPGTVDELIERALKTKARGQNKLLKYLKEYSDARDRRTLRRKPNERRTDVQPRDSSRRPRRRWQVYARKKA